MIFFFGFICFPWINKFIPVVGNVLNENRALTKFPRTDTCDMDKLPYYIENYLIDRLSTRSAMIRLHSQLNVIIFKSSPPGIKAFIGKDDWLFLSGEELRTFTGTELFTEGEMQEFKTEILRRQQILSSHKTKLLIAIVPNKANIYPEHMPDHIGKAEHYGYGQQLLEYLKKNNLPVIDLYKALAQNKTHHDLYFKTDNHWNDLGAFVAANYVLSEMKKDFPSITLPDTITYPVKIKKEKGGPIAEMLSIENQVSDLNYSPTPVNFRSTLNTKKNFEPMANFPYKDEYETNYTQNDSTLPRVLLIRDSFGKRFIPYFAEGCSVCTGIWDGWHYGFNEQIIDHTKPNYVVYLITESQLKNVMKYRKQKTTP